MDNKVYVDSEQLTSVAASIKVKANNILNIFQGDCSSAIILGKECLQVSGLDTTAIINSLNKIFTNLSTRINTLSDFLTQKVAGEYDLTSQSIINAFNGNFATELAALLGLTVGTTVVPGVTGNGAGTAGSTGGIATGIIRPSGGSSSGGCSSCQTPVDGGQYSKEQIEKMSDEQILAANGYRKFNCNSPDGCQWMDENGKEVPRDQVPALVKQLRKDMLSDITTPTQTISSASSTPKTGGIKFSTGEKGQFGLTHLDVEGREHQIQLSDKEIAILEAKGYVINKDRDSIVCGMNGEDCYYEIKAPNGEIVDSTAEYQHVSNAIKTSETSAYWSNIGDQKKESSVESAEEKPVFSAIQSAKKSGLGNSENDGRNYATQAKQERENWINQMKEEDTSKGRLNAVISEQDKALSQEKKLANELQSAKNDYKTITHHIEKGTYVPKDSSGKEITDPATRAAAQRAAQEAARQELAKAASNYRSTTGLKASGATGVSTINNNPTQASKIGQQVIKNAANGGR